MYQAGTLSGNPVAMAAGLAMLRYLQSHPEIYSQLSVTTENIVAGISQNLEKLGLDYTLNHVGSMFSIFFTNQQVVDFEQAKKSDTALFGQYFRGMLEKGVYLAPSQFEALFVSAAIDEELAGRIVAANYDTLKALH